MPVMDPIDMPRTDPTSTPALRLHRGDARPDAGPLELEFEARGRFVVRLWTAKQWSLMAEARRPPTAVETADGGWVDVAPG